MSLLSTVAGWFGRNEPEPPTEPQNRVAEESFWKDILETPNTVSGERVTWTNAITNPTALRCGLVISDGISTVPCKLMRKDPATGRREEATDHPLYWLFKRNPSPVQNSLELRETMALHCVFTGNAFAYKNMVRGRVKELIVIPPHAVQFEQNADYSLVYTVTAPDGSQEKFPASAIWHLRGPSWDGYSGLDIVWLLRNTIGLAMATQRAHASRFGNGVQTSGLFSTDAILDETQHKRLSNWIKRHFTSPDNSGKPMLLDRGMSWTPLEMSGVDAEHVDTRVLQIEEICTGFGVKPIMIGHADKTATYASAEQMFLAHAVHTIRPWHRRMEASMNSQLLTEDEMKQGYYFKFFDTELLRGAAKDRADYYRTLIEIGAASPNDVAAMEDMEAFEEGDMRYRPSNYVPITAQTNEQPAPGQGQTPSSDQTATPPSSDQPPANAQRMNAGRVLSAQNEGLIRDAAGNLDTVLQKLDTQEPST